MITHSHYESDNRVRRYAEALAKRGDCVEVIALRGASPAPDTEDISGVRVYRIQSRERNEGSKWTYVWRLMRFLLGSARFLTRRHRESPYDVIHVHNMPDFLVFAAVYPRIHGAKIILDIHDVVPELYASKFGTHPNHVFVRLLKIVEKASMAFADHVIVSNDIWRERLVSRSVSREKSSVFINHVDRAIFYQRARTREDDKFIILFPGVLQKHQGLDVAIEAFARVKDKVPNAEFHIYGSGDALPHLIRLAQSLGVDDRVLFFKERPLNQIVDIIANADLGVVPKLANSFGNEAYSTKIMEFMSQSVPVIVSRTKIDSFYFDSTVVRFFDSGDCVALADAILYLVAHPELRRTLVKNAQEYVERNDWDKKKQAYLNLVDSLVADGCDHLKRPATKHLEVFQ